MTDTLARRINDVAIALGQAAAMPADIDAFGQWWYLNDWRGKKKQPPRPEQIAEEWGRFKMRGTAPGIDAQVQSEHDEMQAELKAWHERQDMIIEAQNAELDKWQAERRNRVSGGAQGVADGGGAPSPATSQS